MIKEYYSPKLLISFVNPMKIPLGREELQFIRDNCFYNLKIEQITKDTIASIYDEILGLQGFYKTIGADSLAEYANDILDKLFDFVPWGEVEKQVLEEERIEKEAVNYIPELKY